MCVKVWENQRRVAVTLATTFSGRRQTESTLEMGTPTAGRCENSEFSVKFAENNEGL